MEKKLGKSVEDVPPSKFFPLGEETVFGGEEQREGRAQHQVSDQRNPRERERKKL